MTLINDNYLAEILDGLRAALTIIDRQFAEPGTEVSIVGVSTRVRARLPTPAWASRASAPGSRPRRTTSARGRNTGAPNCARVLLWSAPIMYFARRVFAR
jgi:hypothetical protein